MDALRNFLSPRTVSRNELFVNYVSAGYNKCITWVYSNCDQLYSKSPNIRVLTRQQLDNSLNLIKSFAWNNKEFIMSAAAIGTALLIMNYYRKNRPQKPIVAMQSSLNFARFSIKTIKTEQAPLNLTLTLCIDTSGSMKEENRLKIAKEALIKVIENAQEVINTSKANIEITIIGFNELPTVITKPTKLIPVNEKSQNNTCKEIIKQIETLTPFGGTNIIKALEKAIKKLNSIAKKNSTASHNLILITDGEHSFTNLESTAVQNKLIEIKSNFFAVGVGDKHNREALKKITNSKKLNAAYIDTTKAKETLEGAIFKIYNQAIAAFSDLELTSSQLIPGSWSVSVNNRFNVMNNDGSVCSLGNLSEKEELINSIEIHPDKLQSPLELSKVTFRLTFKDSKGRPGALMMPWKPNTTIDPAIVKSKQAM